MKTVTLQVEDLIYDFYAKIGAQADRTPEQVMSDGLLRLAGELSSKVGRPIPFPKK